MIKESIYNANNIGNQVLKLRHAEDLYELLAWVDMHREDIMVDSYGLKNCYDELLDPEEIFEGLRDLICDSISMASHYHSRYCGDYRNY